MLTPDPCERHWGPSLSAWVTQKRRSGGEPLATLCRFDHPGNRTPDFPHRKPVRLTTTLTAGTGPKIEPKTSRADSDVFNHCANWSVWLKIMTSQAEYICMRCYEVPFVKYVLHALYGQFCAFPVIGQNDNEKSWTAFCGL